MYSYKGLNVSFDDERQLICRVNIIEQYLSFLISKQCDQSYVDLNLLAKICGIQSESDLIEAYQDIFKDRETGNRV